MPGARPLEALLAGIPQKLGRHDSLGHLSDAPEHCQREVARHADFKTAPRHCHGNVACTETKAHGSCGCGAAAAARGEGIAGAALPDLCLLYTSPSPRDGLLS